MGRINLFVIIAFIAGLSFDCQSSDIININPAKIKESDFDNYWVPYAAITDSNVDKDDGKPLPRSFPQLSKKQKKKQKRAAKREKNNKSNKSKKRSNATNNYKKKGDNNVNIKVVATDDLIKEMWSFLRGVPSYLKDFISDAYSLSLGELPKHYNCLGSNPSLKGLYEIKYRIKGQQPLRIAYKRDGNITYLVHVFQKNDDKLSKKDAKNIKDKSERLASKNGVGHLKYFKIDN